MMIEDKKRKLRWQADEVEDRVRDLKKKENEATHLIQDIARLHQRQREVLNEILYYSKVGNALKQVDGTGEIIYDISKANFSQKQMNEIISRLTGRYGKDVVDRIIFIK